jgi:hypothetical protein
MIALVRLNVNKFFSCIASNWCDLFFRSLQIVEGQGHDCATRAFLGGA